MRKRRDTKPTPAPPEVTATETGAMFTITELAARWRVSRHTVEAAIKAGRLQAFKVGDRVYRIREAEVVRYEQAQNIAVAS